MKDTTKCQRCGSDRVVVVSTKCSDRCYVTFGENEHEGYVPQDMAISSDEDYIDFEYCLACGQIQGQFPLPQTQLEQGALDE